MSAIRTRRLLTVVGCGLLAVTVRLAADDEKPAFSWVDGADPAVSDILRVGNRAVEQYARSFLGEVKRTVGEANPALAVRNMHLKDYKLPAPTPGAPAITAIRRTSLRIRNPANAPDAPDRAALEFIKARLDDGDDLPKVLLQKVAAPGQPVEWRLYQPLGVTQQCLVCHGPRDTLDADIKAALLVHYPDDKATDYPAGAWRGVIRVSIVAAPPAPPKP